MAVVDAVDAKTVHRVTVGMAGPMPDPAGAGIRARLREDLGIEVSDVRVHDVYTICAALEPRELTAIREELLTDRVIQESSLDEPLERDYDFLIEVGFLPGVTDNIGKSAAQGIADVLGRSLGSGETVYKSTQYLITGAVDLDDCHRFTRDLLANELIERWAIKTRNEALAESGRPLLDLPVVTERSDPVVHEVVLEISDDALVELSRARTLALELEEMRAIQEHYRDPRILKGRRERDLPEAPTDIELEVIAQTWSEHCKHKIFAATIEYTRSDGRVETIEGLFNTYIKATTEAVAQHVDWLVSVFDDNAGIIRFDDEWNFALKAETHNSPSALDPYGGAMTGIVGVNRDILGAGLGCRCIFNTDVFCVASPDYAGAVPARLFHPKRVLRGVHQGVKDGGNQSGIPDVNGAIVFHERFLGKPLVFCGTGGLIPAEINGHPTEKKIAAPGDRIVMVGGRIGKDGIHGATFSSEELHAGSPATAVQIGDPITQKNMADFLLEARDLGLFSCITDNGAGGLSSSIGEMARGPGGAEVWLDQAPLKYEGLAPWEIFLSEAQERMTFAVPPGSIEPLMDLARRRDVEATQIGQFTDSGFLECLYEGRCIAALGMEFLHNGVPTMQLKAELNAPERVEEISIEQEDPGEALKAVLATHNVCSKEAFVRMYDHEVLGQSVLKQFQGAEQDGPGDAAVLRPLPDSDRGVAVACGICPKFSDLDAYAMVAAAVDEAVRNLICVGARLGTIAALDNFCWPDPVESTKTPDGRHKLAQLVEACKALRGTCLAYDIPLISGKDSMKNDYKIGDTKISIPPTVLITAVAVMDDVTKAVTMDAKASGDVVYVLGDTREEMGGSEYLNLKGLVGGAPPRVYFEDARLLYERLSDAIERGLVASCHDCSDGGLGVALAETAFAGRYGMRLDITPMKIRNNLVALFSESQSRFVVTVKPEAARDFEAALGDSSFTKLGVVTEGPFFKLKARRARIKMPMEDLYEAWRRPLDW